MTGKVCSFFGIVCMVLFLHSGHGSQHKQCKPVLHGRFPVVSGALESPHLQARGQSHDASEGLYMKFSLAASINPL